VIGQQGPARRRHEGGQALQQLQRIEEQRGRPVAPWPPEAVQELAARALRQPLHGQGRAEDIAAHLLQLIPPACRHRHIRMQTEALQARRAPPGRRHGGRRPEAPHRLPGAGPEGDVPLQRRRDRAGEQRLLRRERVAPGVLVRPPPPAEQQPPHAPVQPREQHADVRVGRRRQAVEPGPRRRARARVDAVEEQRVEMNIEIRGSAKSLDGRDAAAPRPDQPPPRRAPSLPAEHRAQAHPQHGPREPRVERQLVAHWQRHREDPLADRDGRDDPVDEVRGELTHPPPAAGGAERTALTTEGDHRRVATALTAHAEQTMPEDATPEVSLELAPDEGRPSARPVGPGRPREEGREVGRDGAVEHRLLGLAPLVGCAGA
jgi:hypothetical protein